MINILGVGSRGDGYMGSNLKKTLSKDLAVASKATSFKFKLWLVYYKNSLHPNTLNSTYAMKSIHNHANKGFI